LEDPLRVDGSEERPSTSSTGTHARPRVVVVVRPVSAQSDTRSIPRVQASRAQEASTAAPRHNDAVLNLAETVDGVPEAPTTKIARKQLQRTPEDEVLVAAVIPLDLRDKPGVLDDFLGRTLMHRAAHAAAEAGAPRLVLLGRLPEDQHRRVFQEAHDGFLGGKVEVVGDDLNTLDFGGRGRVLVLDARALHEPRAIRRLRMARGDQTVLLVGEQGDGPRTRIEGQKVREFGEQLSPPFDGYFAGAASVPVEHFEHLTRQGGVAALEQLIAEERLGVELVKKTYNQSFERLESYALAQRRCYDSLASDGKDGFLDDLLGKPLAGIFTRQLLHTPVSATVVSVLAALCALVGCYLLAFRGGWGALGGGLALALSAVLDRTDGELARLRLDPDMARRKLDFGLDHLAHILVFLGLGWGVHATQDLTHAFQRIPALEEACAFLTGFPNPEVVLGIWGAVGVVLLGCVLIYRGVPRHEATNPFERAGNALASVFSSRESFYLIPVLAGVNLLFKGLGLLGLLLLVSALLIWPFWIALLLFTAVTPSGDD
jgi:hypothetical protein